jgi:hypothetical protein
MTEQRWRAAVAKLRRMLDKGTQRKVAILAILDEYGVSQSQLYVWCKILGVSLK